MNPEAFAALLTDNCLEVSAGQQVLVRSTTLAALDPAVCWPGHLGPLEGDVRAQLERAAGA